MQAAVRLHANNLSYYWTWLPVKLGYGKYDEGMAIFSRSPITAIDNFYISTFRDYNNWKTRQVLGVKIADCDDWFYTMHMGWWDDKDDPFSVQWERFKKQLSIKNHSYNTWLLGDFNSPAEVRNEGYDLIKDSGFLDTYQLATTKDCGITVEGIIDGWRDKLEDANASKGMRIDHIFSKEKVSVRSSNVVFNGQNEPVISDHFGIIIETD